MLDLCMRANHPWVQLVVGRRGSGKSQTISRILCDWPTHELGTTLAIDFVATDPPLPEHCAAWATRWRASAPDELHPDVGLVACDEATLVLTGTREEKPLFRELFLRGRHRGPLRPDGRPRGISVLMGTQRPKDLPQAAFTQADRVVIHCVQGVHDLQRLSELPGMTDEALRMVECLPPGYAVIWDARAGLFLPEVPEWRR
jgi:hypothetical protein